MTACVNAEIATGRFKTPAQVATAGLHALRFKERACEEKVQHVFLYRAGKDHIYFSRVLHQQMATELYRFD